MLFHNQQINPCPMETMQWSGHLGQFSRAKLVCPHKNTKSVRKHPEGRVHHQDKRMLQTTVISQLTTLGKGSNLLGENERKSEP